MELKQDIKDNGKLDCRREPLKLEKGANETDEQRLTRLQAVWNSGKINDEITKHRLFV